MCVSVCVTNPTYSALEQVSNKVRCRLTPLEWHFTISILLSALDGFLAISSNRYTFADQY